jgi:hypothetical protein
MVLPANNDIVNAQKSVRHTGNRLVVSESIEDTIQAREKDTGAYDQED